jgi:hypothetical protein
MIQKHLFDIGFVHDAAALLHNSCMGMGARRCMQAPGAEANAWPHLPTRSNSGTKPKHRFITFSQGLRDTTNASNGVIDASIVPVFKLA